MKIINFDKNQSYFGKTSFFIFCLNSWQKGSFFCVFTHEIVSRIRTHEEKIIYVKQIFKITQIPLAFDSYRTIRRQLFLNSWVVVFASFLQCIKKKFDFFIYYHTK